MKIFSTDLPALEALRVNRHKNLLAWERNLIAGCYNWTRDFWIIFRFCNNSAPPSFPYAWSKWIKLCCHDRNHHRHVHSSNDKLRVNISIAGHKDHLVLWLYMFTSYLKIHWQKQTKRIYISGTEVISSSLKWNRFERYTWLIDEKTLRLPPNQTRKKHLSPFQWGRCRLA